MVSLEQFKENAFARGICKEFRAKWKDGLSNKQYIDMALCVKGAEYLVRAYAEGWGISKEAILSRFKAFINGKYIFDNGDYTSQLYCGFKGKIIEPSTLLIILDSEVEIDFPEYYMTQIYITGKESKLRIKNGTSVIVFVGDTPKENIIYDNAGRGIRYELQCI